MSMVKAQGIDIYRYPNKDIQHASDDHTQFTIGDLHGNAVKFLHFLIRQNILDLSAAEYDDIVQIYRKNVNELMKKDLIHFNHIINKAKVIHPAMIRLIGNELADRGNNDYFTLKLIEKLGKKKIPMEILLSNHDAEFLYSYEHGLHEFYSPRISYRGQSRSFENLGRLKEKGLIALKEIQDIIALYYLPNLKLIAYNFHEKKKTLDLYTHAPVGLETIRALALKFGLDYHDETAQELMKTIDAINKQFASAVKNKEISMLCDFGTNCGTVDKNPLIRLMWHSGYEGTEMPQEKNNYKLKYIHGHDDNTDGSMGHHVVNLDKNNVLGAHYGREEHNIGTYSILSDDVN